MKGASMAHHKTNLTNFDELPNSAHVRQPAVQALYACSHSTLWRWVNEGRIPSPRKLGRTTIWNVGELRASLKSIEEGC